MLDDPLTIDQCDSADMIGLSQTAWQQLNYRFEADAGKIDFSKVKSVVYTGMGGSALAAVIFEAIAKDGFRMPFSLYRDYTLPAWVDENCLVITASYSGNTEETLSAYDDALAKGAQIIALASSGELARRADEHGWPVYLIPRVAQPRMSAFYMLKALSEIVRKLAQDTDSPLSERLEKTADSLQQSTAGWGKDIASEFNLAKQLALRLKDKSIVIMGGPIMSAAAYKWKIGFNESSKNVAFYSVWPEFDHNEFIGWSHKPDDKPFAIVELQSSFEPARIRQRYDISNNLLLGKLPEPIIVEAYGQTAIEQLLWAVMLGDHVSCYLAILNGVDPAPVKLVEQLKTELADKQ